MARRQIRWGGSGPSTPPHKAREGRMDKFTLSTTIVYCNARRTDSFPYRNSESCGMATSLVVWSPNVTLEMADTRQNGDPSLSVINIAASQRLLHFHRSLCCNWCVRRDNRHLRRIVGCYVFDRVFVVARGVDLDWVGNNVGFWVCGNPDFHHVWYQSQSVVCLTISLFSKKE